MQTIALTQFCGKDSTAFSGKADRELLMCLYRETIQSGDEENAYVLYKTPGLQAQMTTALGRHRGTFELNGFIFDVIGQTLLGLDSSLNAAAPLASYSPIGDDGANVVFAADPDNLAITSGGVLYVIGNGVMTSPAIPTAFLSIAQINTYWVGLGPQSQLFFTFDPLVWDPLDFQTAEASPNFMIAMIEDHGVLWTIGNRTSQVFTIGTDPNTPLVPRQEAIIQKGTAAPMSVVALDSSLLWLAQDKAGSRTIVKATGFNPATVSTYSIENELRKMTRVDDCIALPFQLNGHEHVWFTFPEADKTLCYDATENDWYHVGWWNVTLGKYERHRANCIVSAFGKILVGDRENGSLYELSPEFYDDDGSPIRWLRRCPHITKNGKNVQYGRLEITAEVGVGL